MMTRTKGLTAPIILSSLLLSLSFAQSASAGDAALADLEARCDAGAATACFEAGLRYEAQQGAAPERISGLFIKACEGGDLRGCNSAGVAYRRGYGLERNPERASALMERACQGKLAAGCFNLAAMLIEGDSGHKDLLRGTTLLERACDAEYGPACSARGALEVSGPEAPHVDNLRAARTYFQRACTLKDSEGCYNLGQVTRSLGEATHVTYAAYEKACRHGAAAGCNWQGLMLHSGQAGQRAMRRLSARKAQQRGVSLMLKACEAGFPEGCFNAGLAHIKGAGVAKDHQRAGALLTRACEGRVSAACKLLASQKTRKSP